MTMMEQLEMIFRNEQEQLVEHELPVCREDILDIDLHKRYTMLVDRHKKVLGMVSELLNEYNCENQALIESKAAIERQNFFLKRQNKKLYTMCAFDTLTEVYTRQFLLEAINRELKKAIYEHKEMVIAILDIDNFKSVMTIMGIKTVTGY